MPAAGPTAAEMEEARRQLEEAERLRQQGRLDRAESACHALTRRYPGYMAALHTLGLIHLDKRNYDRALDCLNRALMLDPQSWMTLTALARTYARLGATEMAAQTLERAITIKSDDPAILVSLAEILRDEREYERAVDVYRQALARDPSLDSAAIGLGLVLGAIGENAEARAVFESLLLRGCRTLDLFHAMTTLPTAALPGNMLDLLEAVQCRKEDADSKLTSLFVRGAALDAAGRHAEAWDCFRSGNKTMAAALDGERRRHVAREQANLAVLRATRQGAAAADARLPVSLFILGPSRSGKTTLERLVGTLDGVKRGFENPGFDASLKRAFHAAALPPSRHLEQLPRNVLPAFRDIYLDDLLRRAGSARVFSNSTPGRIHDATLIATTIPNARFVFVTRDRNDNALRIFMTKYLQGNPYAYDLTSIHAHLDWYDQMAALIVDKFPTLARRVSYEDMVADPVTALTTTADLCGLTSDGIKIPDPGDDRSCAQPYRRLMDAWK